LIDVWRPLTRLTDFTDSSQLTMDKPSVARSHQRHTVIPMPHGMRGARPGTVAVAERFVVESSVGP